MSNVLVLDADIDARDKDGVLEALATGEGSLLSESDFGGIVVRDNLSAILDDEAGYQEVRPRRNRK